jgi:hypothetical protein
VKSGEWGLLSHDVDVEPEEAEKLLNNRFIV